MATEEFVDTNLDFVIIEDHGLADRKDAISICIGRSASCAVQAYRGFNGRLRFKDAIQFVIKCVERVSIERWKDRHSEAERSVSRREHPNRNHVQVFR